MGSSTSTIRVLVTGKFPFKSSRLIMPRVGILALIQESNTFLPGATTLDHFRQELLLSGVDVRTQFINAHHEVRGFFDGLAKAGFATTRRRMCTSVPLIRN